MAIDVRITDVPFSEAPDHEAKVFINDGGKLRQTDLTTIAKYSALYELIVGAHNDAMSEISQQLESGQLSMTEAFDSYNAQLTDTHTSLETALTSLKAEIETDMTQRDEVMRAEYADLRDEYTNLFSENTEALEETRKHIDEQIQAGTACISQQSQDVLSQLTELYNSSTTSLQNTKDALEAALNTKYTGISNDLDATLNEHIEASNTLHQTHKAEIEQIIADGQSEIQGIIDNIGDLQNAVDAMEGIKNDIKTLETSTPTYTVSDTLTDLVSGELLTVAFGKIKKAVSTLLSHLADNSNPHAVDKTDVGLGNVINERQYSASNPQPSVSRVSFSNGTNDVERTLLVGSESTSGQNVYAVPGVTANYSKKTLTAEGGFKGTADSATTLVGLTATVGELNQLQGATGNIQDQIDDLGKSVADGKELLATTISEFGYSEVASGATFDEINTGIVGVADGKYADGFKYGYSPNGTSWTASSNCVGKDLKFVDVEHHFGVWIACSTRVGLYYSYNGISWSACNGADGIGFNSVKCADGIWVACSSDGNGVYYSTDSLNWTQSSITSGTFKAIEHANGLWTVVSYQQGTNTIYYSTDGKTWTRTSFTLLGLCNRILYANGYWVAVGQYSSSSGTYQTFGYSTDGKTWTGKTDVSPQIYWVEYANGYWVLATIAGIMYSTDLATWTTVTGSKAYAPQHIAYGDGIWVCSSPMSPIIAYSSNVTKWTTISFYPTNSISYANGIFAIATKSSAKGMCYMLGMIASPKECSVTSNSIMRKAKIGVNSYSGNPVWVAVGDGGIWYSFIWQTRNVV